MEELQLAVDLGRQAMMLAVKVAFPVLLAGLVVGLVVSILQSATQVQEQTLSHVPRLIVVVAAVMVLLPWMLSAVAGFARTVMTDMVEWIR